MKSSAVALLFIVIYVPCQLLDNDFFTVYNVDTVAWGCYFSSLQIVLCVLTMPSVRNPSGITCGYTALDKMLPALSKLSTILLYKCLFTVDDINTFQISVFTFQFYTL
jgi:hypothetical protein